MGNGKQYGAERKAKIIIEALEGERTISEIGGREGISPKVISNWKREFIDNAYKAFSISKTEKAAEERAEKAEQKERELMAKIGELTYELDWAKKKSEEIEQRRKVRIN